MTPVEVARLLRHSDPGITLTTYARLDDASIQRLGEKLAAGLGGKWRHGGMPVRIRLTRVWIRGAPAKQSQRG